MKRFYEQVSLVDAAEGISVRLDGRPVRTPARALLALPSAPLAEGVAEEWRAQGDTIDPRSMPLTGLANAAIDRVAADTAAFARPLAAYGETDLLCYRADGPDDLVALQRTRWDPLLAWATRRYDVGFVLVTGILHAAQPPATVARLAEAVASRDAFALAGLSPLVTLGGSLVAALAVVEGEIAPDAAFDVTHLDEIWQAAQWAEDRLATEARAARRAAFVAGARFAALAAG